MWLTEVRSESWSNAAGSEIGCTEALVPLAARAAGQSEQSPQLDDLLSGRLGS